MQRLVVIQIIDQFSHYISLVRFLLRCRTVDDLAPVQIRINTPVVHDPGVALIVGSQVEENESALLLHEHKAVSATKIEFTPVVQSGLPVTGQLAAQPRIY